MRHSEPASLTVFERPVFVETPSDVVAMESDRVMFRCQAEGVPLPTISWRRDGAEIPEDRYICTLNALRHGILETRNDSNYV